MAYSSGGSRPSGQVLGAASPSIAMVTPGQVLGAATGVGAGAAVLPRTGVGSVVFYLVLLAMVAAALIILSFVITRIIKAWF